MTMGGEYYKIVDVSGFDVVIFLFEIIAILGLITLILIIIAKGVVHLEEKYIQYKNKKQLKNKNK